MEEELKKEDSVVSVEDDDRDPFASDLEEDEDEERINELWIEEDMDAQGSYISAENGTSSEDDSDN